MRQNKEEKRKQIRWKKAYPLFQLARGKQRPQVQHFKLISIDILLQSTSELTRRNRCESKQKRRYPLGRCSLGLRFEDGERGAPRGGGGAGREQATGKIDQFREPGRTQGHPAVVSAELHQWLSFQVENLAGGSAAKEHRLSSHVFSKFSVTLSSSALASILLLLLLGRRGLISVRSEKQ